MKIHQLVLFAALVVPIATHANDKSETPTPLPPTPPLPIASPAQAVDLPQVVRLRFVNSKVSDILSLYRDLVPEEIIVDSAIQMGTPVTIQTKGEVSREKAVEMIESTLMLNGYTLLQQAPGTIKLLGPGKFPRSQGTPIYYSPAELPKGERVVTYFMSLKNIKAADAVQLFQAQVSPPNSYTSLITATNANAVLITESTSVIRQLVGMQPSFDVPSQTARSR